MSTSPKRSVVKGGVGGCIALGMFGSLGASGFSLAKSNGLMCISQSSNAFLPFPKSSVFMGLLGLFTFSVVCFLESRIVDIWDHYG